MLSTAFATALLLAATFIPVHPVSPPAKSALAPPGPVLLTVTKSTPPPTDASGADPTAEEREFITRINGERTQRGLSALTPDPRLAQTARRHSQDMSAHAYFSHYAPSGPGRTPMDRYVSALHTDGQSLPDSLLVGENIYYCSQFRGAREVCLAHQALMNSPEHRANILGPRFAHVGIGVYCDTRGQIWVTEMFMRDTK